MPPLTASTRAVALGDVTLALDEWSGSAGRPVLFLHATGFARGVWRPAVELVAPRCRPFALDLRGHGGSTVPPPPYAFADFRDDLLALIERERWSGLVICGHSLGGLVAVEVAIARPEAVAALVLVEAPLRERGGPQPQPVQMPALLERTLKRRWQWGSRAEAVSYLRARVPYDSWHDAAFEGFMTTGLRASADGGVELACPPEVEAASFRAAGESRAYDLLPQLRCPVWVGRGDGDRGMPSTTGAEAAGRIPHAVDVVARGDGHFAPLERPRWVAGLVCDALDHLEGRATTPRAD